MIANAKLDRQTFSVSRELEYFSEAELVTQTGCRKQDWWPGVIIKELIDNSLDACEQAGIPPHIEVSFDSGSLKVSDNGPGLPPDVLARILDFSSRTSSKVAYISPMRGAQGNAFKTILAIPFVLGQGRPGKVEVESCGIRHTIIVSTNQVLQRPEVEHHQEEIVKKPGTAVQVTVDLPSSQTVDESSDFLQNLLRQYSLFNPQSTFELLGQGKLLMQQEATATGWRKWLPSDPTSAHWYDRERLETLIGNFIAAETTGGKIRSVREFVSEFRGLSSSAKCKQVSEQAGLQRSVLRELVVAGQFDHELVSRLLAAMQELSAAVRPEALGILGKEHFAQRLKGNGETFRYACKKGEDDSGVPYLIECAFAMTPEDGFRGLHVGLNWTASLKNPLRSNIFRMGEGRLAYGLDGLLAEQRISSSSDPVCLAVHIASPLLRYLDRGKGGISLNGEDVQDSLFEAVLGVTKEWAAIKRKEDREGKRDTLRRSRYLKSLSPKHLSVKDAAYATMAEAYNKASGGGLYPAAARQVMYAARPGVQDLTGDFLDDKYFTQTLLPDYMREHPVETVGWDVIYDDRGHFMEPHTGKQIGIGTVSVRNYFSEIDCPVNLRIQSPWLDPTFPTCGPGNRYGSILYVEKEGFLQLLERAKFAQRYDMAVMSSKGMGTVAARKLIEELSKTVPVFVLHDCDQAGFNIAGTLTRNTRRYSFANKTNVTDLGLRLTDVKEWSLQSEDVSYRSDPTTNLKVNGATAAEIKYLYQGGNAGQRVELNAFTSDQFVAFLDAKLIRYGVKKVIPEEKMLERAYRRAAGLEQFQSRIDEIEKEVATYAEKLEVPRNLQSALGEKLAENTALPWDEVLATIVAAQKRRKSDEYPQ